MDAAQPAAVDGDVFLRVRSGVADALRQRRERRRVRAVFFGGHVALAGGERSHGARAVLDSRTSEFREEARLSAGSDQRGAGVFGHRHRSGGVGDLLLRGSGDARRVAAIGAVAAGADRSSDFVYARAVLVSGGAGGVCARSGADYRVHADAVVFSDADLLPGIVAAEGGVGSCCRRIRCSFW